MFGIKPLEPYAEARVNYINEIVKISPDSPLKRIEVPSPAKINSDVKAVLDPACKETLRFKPYNAPLGNLVSYVEPHQRRGARNIFFNAGYGPVNIWGGDNRCWARAGWFAILYHHNTRGTLDELKNRIESILFNSKHTDVKKCLKSNPYIIHNTFSDLKYPLRKLDQTLNSSGTFTKNVEDLMLLTCKAFFKVHGDQLSKSVRPDKCHPLKCIDKGLPAPMCFMAALAKELNANFPYHELDRSSYSNENRTLDVSWCGTNDEYPKQTDCIVTYRDRVRADGSKAENGHFEVFVQDNHDISYAVSNALIYNTSKIHGADRTQWDLMR